MGVRLTRGERKNKGRSLMRRLSSTVGLVIGMVTQSFADEGVPVPPLDAGLVLTLHPIFVHFAIALIVFGMFLDCGGSILRNRDWQRAGQIGFFVGAGAIGLAVLSGWIEQQLPQPSSVFDSQVQELFFYHEYGGYILLGFFAILTVARLQINAQLPLLYMVLAGLGLIGLTIQGYWGGEMVYRYGAGVRAVQVLSEAAAIQARQGGLPTQAMQTESRQSSPHENAPLGVAP